jgi:hypothetical protein
MDETEISILLTFSGWLDFEKLMKRKTTLLGAMLIFDSWAQVFGVEIFVSPTGDDTNPGTAAHPLAAGRAGGVKNQTGNSPGSKADRADGCKMNIQMRVVSFNPPA